MDSEEKNRILSIFEKKKYSDTERGLINKALSYIIEKGSDNGEKILEISRYLREKDAGADAIIAGILILDYEDGDEKEVKASFNENVLQIVQEVKKISGIMSKSQEKNEFTREVIISSVERIESIILELIIKLVTIKSSPDKDLAKTIIDNYIPLANRLGFERIRKELANYAFKALNPKKYEEISNFLKMSEKEREVYIRKIIEELNDEIKKEIRNFEIKGREKQIYSIYEKAVNRKVPINEQKDHFGVRVITESVEDCYKVFEILNERYDVLEKSFKDYIRNPKDNGYQSIHFCIKKADKIIEIQVRTKEMDEFAEEGTASHWAYKKINGDIKFEKKTAWYKELLRLKEKKGSVLEGLKIGLFKDKIYCYTPKGKMVQLESGATALDFAYSIHAQIGNSSVGTKINGKFVPLKSELKNGDTVEIITNKFQRPRREWLKYVKTKYAKKIIAKEIKRIENIPVPKIKGLSEKEYDDVEVPAKIPEFPNHIINFAKCCNPLPEEDIIGVLRSYKRALIHKKGCERIGDGKNNGIKAEWKEVLKNPVKIFVSASDRSGILADIINTISRKGFKITEANGKLTGNSTAECYFKVSVGEIRGLREIISRIQKIRDVKKIWFD
jgi:GTP pyrophosphokinase